jgi:hypothetical protein
MVIFRMTISLSGCLSHFEDAFGIVTFWQGSANFAQEIPWNKRGYVGTTIASASVMYTLHMSWQFRALVLGVLVSLGVAPQLACFMPDEPATASDMDCCKERIGACTAPNMSHGCCQTVAPTELGLVAKAFRQVMPRLDVAQTPIAPATDSFFETYGQFSRKADHAPPDSHSPASLVLRI